MAYRFVTRPTAPGAYRLAVGVLGALLSAGNVVDGVERGDGVTGTYPTTEATNAAHQAADVVTLNANLDEMIPANDSIKAAYAGVLDGTAAGGGTTVVGILGIKAS